MSAYIDTSALAKCYIREARSLDVLSWAAEQNAPVTAALTLIEFRCLLACRRRNGEISPALEHDALAHFDDHVRSGAWFIPHDSRSDYAVARGLIDALPSLPLRALDALHLAAARSAGTRDFATADKTQASAAEALGFTVHRFY